MDVVDNRTKDNWKKNITLFLASQTISLFGSMLVQYAITWHITLKTQSGLMMTLSIICGFLPTFFLSPFAGVWADRYSRKLLIVISDGLIALATLIVAVIFMIGHDAIWLLFAASAVRSIGSGIQMPAVGALFPEIVPGEKLTQVNGINSSIQSFTMLIAPMLSGALMTVSTIEAIFFIDVVTAAIAIGILLFFLRIPAHAKAFQKQEYGYFSDMMEGIRYIKRHAFLRNIFIFSAVFMILVVPLAFLTPLLVTRNFGEEVWRLTAIEISYSLGMMGGGMLIAAWGGFRNKLHTMVLANAITAVGTLALGLIPVFRFYLLMMVLMGITFPVFNTPFSVLLQQKVEQGYLGRVFGVLTMISSSVMPLSMLVFGPVADLVKIEWLYIGTGLLMLVQSALMARDKALIEAGKPAPNVE